MNEFETTTKKELQLVNRNAVVCLGLGEGACPYVIERDAQSPSNIEGSGDLRGISGGTMREGSDLLECAAASFSMDDLGKEVCIPGANAQ